MILAIVLTWIGVQAIGAFVLVATSAHRDEPPFPADDNMLGQVVSLGVVVVVYAHLVAAGGVGWLVNRAWQAPKRMLEALRNAK